METATFVNVRNAKSGKVVGEIRFENGRTMPVPAGITLSADMNNKVCEVERGTQGITSLKYDGTELIRPVVAPSTRPTAPARSVQPQGANSQPVRHGAPTPNFVPATNVALAAPAKAPYNFVPLNERVIEGEPAADFSAYHEGRLSGNIQCEIENLTPLYIRDTLDEQQVAGNDESNDNPEFFSPAGRYRIPGSSLRGMVRNLVEIMSYGRMLCDGKRKFFFRQVGDTSALGIHYRDTMTHSAAEGYCPKIKAGFLRRKGPNSYEMLPSRELEDTQFYRVNYDYRSRIVRNTNIRINKFEFREVYFRPVAPAMHDHRGGKLRLKYALVENVSESPMQGYVKGYMISSGDFAGTKHMHWIINDASGTAIPIDREIIKDYQNDSSRDERSDLLKMLERNQNAPVPCFYLTDDSGAITSLGFTGMYRLAYRTRVGDHINQSPNDDKTIDLCEAIFGKSAGFASRVCFEDASLQSAVADVAMPVCAPKILSSPKPTTFQHYLDQHRGRGRGEQFNSRNLRHWDSDCVIRGHKMYWHKNSDSQGVADNLKWAENTLPPPNDTQHTRIKPARPGAQFSGRIRFENLTEVELGALLFALDLPENHYHKLGMGKPLGLGTVKITPKLYLCDRKTRYSSLFAEDGWQLAESKTATVEYKSVFERHILDRLDVEAQSLWDVNRMANLKSMLSYQNANAPGWSEATRYLRIETGNNEYRNRDILPEPVDVRGNFRNRN